jgi:hypothetical protein
MKPRRRNAASTHSGSEFVAVKPISTLDPLNVAARIDELKLLKTGWLNGKGIAPIHDGLNWLVDAFDRRFPDDLPLPHLYPTAEGGVRAEWTMKPHELSLDIDLTARTGDWHLLNLDNDAEQSRKLDLDDAKDWQWLIAEVRGFAGANI